MLLEAKMVLPMRVGGCDLERLGDGFSNLFLDLGAGTQAGSL